MKSEVIVAISTALGKGAIGVIRLSGNELFEIIKKFVVFPKNVDEPESHKLYLAKIVDGEDFIDDVMFVLMRNPRSYTGEDVAEISAHNNLHILNKILALAIKFGARIAKPGEFTERAFLNGKMDLSQAEAVAEILSAESEFAEKIAAKQLQGRLSDLIANFRGKTLDILSNVEVMLDHDDVFEFNRQKLAQEIRFLNAELEQKISVGRRASRFYQGLKIALVGRPNVGKSSLLNAIVDQEKAIVSDLPGTTRDPVEVEIEHKSIKIKIIDTAGMKTERELASDEQKFSDFVKIEKLGIRKTKEFIENVDYIFSIFDLSNENENFELIFKEVEKQIRENKVIVVGNKKDKKSEKIYENLKNFADKLGIKKFVEISALKKENIECLLDCCINDFLESREIFENSFVLNVRYEKIFSEIEKSLKTAAENLDSSEALEIVAMDLRRAVDLFGQILGLDVSEEILNRIFSNFCVGK